MSRATGIEWCDATWNPIRGCSRVSEGCRNCYAEAVANRFCRPGAPYEGVVQLGPDDKGNGKWSGAIKFVEKRLLDPLRWKKPLRIFVNSMSDLFHENVTDEMRDRIFAVMALCPQHTFQVLTKRPERMLTYLSDTEVERRVAMACVSDQQPLAPGYFSQPVGGGDLYEVFESKGKLSCVDEDGQHPATDFLWFAADFHWPLKNLWLGVSVEDQKAADERIPLLLQTPAAKRFISAEPLLGALDLTNINAMIWFSKYMASINPHEAMRQANNDFYPKHCSLDALTGYCDAIEPELQERIDWVIVGGESGPGARPMHPDWARSLRDQCVAAGVPFFFKQWGEWIPFSDSVALTAQHPNLASTTKVALLKSDGAVISPYCHLDAPGQQVARVGKKAAGRLLDGREWNEWPV